MAIVSKTLGPLHFEDLEPKRFEDLVRQLVYEFKPWRRLEATGRAGSDDGFDARGFEMLDDRPLATDEAEESALAPLTDRLWLVQCKRERTITPAKLANYLDDIRLGDGEALHGVIFAAACDFSKTSRDTFARKCEALGVKESHLWGKAELEDKLFQPNNDSLLFAYFGISLAIRRRSQRADLRARLALKRKAYRILGPKTHYHVLLRSPDALDYPNADAYPDFKRQPPWLVRPFRGFTYEGLSICIRRYFAYLGDDGQTWDAAMALNDAYGSAHQDPWREDEELELRSLIHSAWAALPERNQAWLEVLGIIAFDALLDIDELGDEFVPEPHIYVPFVGRDGPFQGFVCEVASIERYDPRKVYLKDDTEHRISAFPEEYRMRKPQP